MFWGIVFLISLGIVVMADDDTPFGASVFIALLGGVFIVLLSKPPNLDWMIILRSSGFYVVWGLVWATTRWYLLLSKTRRVVLASTGQSLKVVKDRLRDQVDYRLGANYPPTPQRFSSTIWFWVVFWPFDLIALATNKPWRWISQNVGHLFSNMGNVMLKGIELPKE